MHGCWAVCLGAGLAAEAGVAARAEALWPSPVRFYTIPRRLSVLMLAAQNTQVCPRLGLVGRTLRVQSRPDRRPCTLPQCACQPRVLHPRVLARTPCTAVGRRAQAGRIAEEALARALQTADCVAACLRRELGRRLGLPRCPRGALAIQSAAGRVPHAQVASRGHRTGAAKRQGILQGCMGRWPCSLDRSTLDIPGSDLCRRAGI